MLCNRSSPCCPAIARAKYKVPNAVSSTASAFFESYLIKNVDRTFSNAINALSSNPATLSLLTNLLNNVISSGIPTIVVRKVIREADIRPSLKVVYGTILNIQYYNEFLVFLYQSRNVN